MSLADHDRAESLVARSLATACRVLALAGGWILAALTLMVMASVAGRIFGHPIQGDFELVQVGAAVAITFFLPYCQWRRGNIIVDFFTARASRRALAWLDALGALLFTTALGVVAWRSFAGAVAIQAANETTMIMGVPLWYGYALMTPAFALAAVVGLHTVLTSLRGR